MYDILKGSMNQNQCIHIQGSANWWLNCILDKRIFLFRWQINRNPLFRLSKFNLFKLIKNFNVLQICFESMWYWFKTNRERFAHNFDVFIWIETSTLIPLYSLNFECSKLIQFSKNDLLATFLADNHVETFRIKFWLEHAAIASLLQNVRNTKDPPPPFLLFCLSVDVQKKEIKYRWSNISSWWWKEAF